MISTASQADAFRTSVQLLLQLDELMLAGKDETPEADALREQMEFPWEQMTSEEQSRVQWLSEDLYLLAEQEPKPAPMMELEIAEWTNNLKRALASSESERLLTLLRQPYPETVTPAIILALRARCYFRMGVPEVALRFMQEAAQLEPAYSVEIVQYLKALDQEQQAQEFAKRKLQESSAPEQLCQAAELQLLI